ncbi:hypothetical protein WL1483_68 [Aeromonas schubertii]|uniref:Uncharacterized protein n=1 Tax=Aeromonas schubertii TaxID=652 RepID=A0A0S2SCZ2_9GAMM|nr:hypothetical protein WL1483_68 [Aeromonas schubertii]
MDSPLMRLRRMGREEFLLEGGSPAHLEELGQAPCLWPAL